MKKSVTKKKLALGAAAFSLLAVGMALPTMATAQAPRLMTPSLSMGGQLSFADLVEQVSPAVVSVSTERSVEVAAPRRPRGLEEFLERQYGNRFREAEPETQERRSQSQGSGFFIDQQGHIVTNHHVIEGADKITVRLADGEELEAELVGSDPGTDLAVLKVNAEGSQSYVQFADEVNLRVGDWVLAVGNPFGLGGTVTSGIVSAIGRTNYTSSYADFIQIDAPINRGNSGGPTFDPNGRVVGVNTAIFSPTGGSVGIGFAIPGDTANYIVRQLIDKGSVTRGWLGVEIREFDNNHAAAVGLGEAKGALVVNVDRDTPAGRAGVESGDIVLEFDGEEVEDARELTRAVGNVKPGETVSHLVYRSGKEQTVRVKLGDREKGLGTAEAPEEETSADEELTETLGVSFRGLDNEIRDELDLDDSVSGVLITAVEPNSLAAEALLVPGMVIIEADYKKVTSPSDLQKKIKNAQKDDKEALLLRVLMGGRKDFRALPLEDQND